jgi:hypothetical protein
MNETFDNKIHLSISYRERSFMDDESEQNTSSDVLLEDKILDTSIGSQTYVVAK